MTPPTEPNTVGRRGFIVGLVALLAAGTRFLHWRASSSAPETDAENSSHKSPLAPHESHDAESHDKPAADQPARNTKAGKAIFDQADHGTLFALADVIVPRDGTAPAASEIDLLPRLESWIQSDSSRRFTYSALWPELRRAAHLPTDESKPLPQDQLEASCEAWYREYRLKGSRASSAARVFEQLRRDVLRAYYSSDAGHRVLGYTGPAMRMSSASSTA